jgi:hypothetical protein
MAASENGTTRSVGREGNQMKLAYIKFGSQYETLYYPRLKTVRIIFLRLFGRSSEHSGHLFSHALFWKVGKGWVL